MASKRNKLTITPHIRWMIRRDMPEVLGIEEANFPYPWTEDDFTRCLRQRNCIAMVAEHDERVVGFIIYELHKTCIYVLSMAVHAACQRMGVGTALIRKLEGKLTAGRRDSLILHVRESNLSAQLFFRSCGLRATEIVPEFEPTSEDAYRFELHAAQPVKVRIAE